MSKGIIYKYEDGGSYCGEWEDDASHGYGVCTGPNGQGKFEGLWKHGNQVSGVYTWPKGMKYMGTWLTNVRDGTGREVQPNGTEYSGDFTKGSRGPYGVTRLPNGVYRGAWYNGTQDGEGVEAYVDGGYYRGQYKKGVRHGYGARSSASYEHRESQGWLPKNFSEPQFNVPLLSKSQSSVPSLKVPTAASSTHQKQPDVMKGSLLTNGKERSVSITSTSHPYADQVQDPNAQIYRGEWKDDKRHGYGVLRVLGLYTYYGEWYQNARTGYGVLSYESGRKEEGLWQNGKLIEVFKRKKLSFKTSQLESKLKQAHTNAIQAADTARNKGLLAESRASSALAKSRLAQKTAQQATHNAQLARDKAELYKNAPKITEGAKTPMVEQPLSFPAINRITCSPISSGSQTSLASSKGSDSSKMSLLSVGNKVVPSTSFEDIHSLIQASTNRSSDSDGSIDEADDSFSELNRRREYFRHQTNAGSAGSQTSSDMSLDEASTLRARRQRLIGMGSSEASTTFDSRPYRHDLAMSSVKRRLSDTVVNSLTQKRPLKYTRNNSLSEDDEKGEERMDYCRKRSRVDKTTGELDHGDLTDDELLEEKKTKRTTLPPPLRPLVKKNSVTMEMLTQMANWNKMVAYINFALLVFLLVLILLVVMTLQYYQLSSYYYNHAPDEENQAAANFLTPMA